MRSLTSESTVTRQPRWPAVAVLVFAAAFVAGLIWLGVFFYQTSITTSEYLNDRQTIISDLSKRGITVRNIHRIPDNLTAHERRYEVSTDNGVEYIFIEIKPE